MSDEKITLGQIRNKIDELKKEQYRLENESMKLLNSDGGEGIYTIRPAGRHVLTIGEELIQDQCAAIVELVKNAYDADSPDVKITFERQNEENALKISIEDHGHGMSAEDIISKWLVPSTVYKMKERKSPSGRIMQGRKGIGRYAVNILGDDLFLETVTKNGQHSTLNINWNEFNQHTYLDQVDVKVKTEQSSLPRGTRIIIYTNQEKGEYWNSQTIKKMRLELKRLIPPKADDTFNNDFKILLSFINFYEDNEFNVPETIEPFPILDYYDYRISGNVSADGQGVLCYENQKVKNGINEEIHFDCGKTGCGELCIDIRVYDRDKDAIELLIQRGLKDERSGEYVSKTDARKLIDSINGVGVYRNGFRIRPLGDADFDWLKLNEQRVQNPSMKIGSNQVAGYVHVESEELSHLEEKSARDGLKDNFAYVRLREITSMVIYELEIRRFLFRRKMGLSSPKKKIEKQLDGLYDYTNLQKSVSHTLQKAGMSKEAVLEINDLIEKEQQRKNETVEEIKKTVAIYQGQATLGKIINIILHEGRRPLNYFQNQIPNLRFYESKFSDQHEERFAKEILNIANGVSDNSKIFVDLFSRLDPLASKRRNTKTNFNIKNVLLGVKAVFQNELDKNGVYVNIECEDHVEFYGWSQDFYTIFTNLVDNSMFWLIEKDCSTRTIAIRVTVEGENIYISYRDSGPGISNDLLESGVIFEPEFTTKPNGTGLGLAIAGEAAGRNGLELKALQDENGAHFTLQTV